MQLEGDWSMKTQVYREMPVTSYMRIGYDFNIQLTTLRFR
jgi:hypothetical protein